MLSRDPDKAKAWAQRSKPLARGSKPLVRTKLVVDRGRYSTDCRIRNSTLPVRSEEEADFYRSKRVPFVRALMADVTVCQAPSFFALAGVEDPLLGECVGPLDPHERLRRGQGGSLLDRRNVVAICRRHHDRCTNAGRRSAEHLARLVVFEGDDGWRLLLAPPGERKLRPA